MIALLFLREICSKSIGSPSHWTITNINSLLVKINSLNDLLKSEVGYIYASMLSRFNNSENRSIAIKTTSECLFMSP